MSNPEVRNAISRRIQLTIDKAKENRPTGNISNLFNETQRQTFLLMNRDNRDAEGNKYFITKEELDRRELQYTCVFGNNPNGNDIYIYYRNNYRFCHAYNSAYLNQALRSIRRP